MKLFVQALHLRAMRLLHDLSSLSLADHGREVLSGDLSHALRYTLDPLFDRSVDSMILTSTSTLLTGTSTSGKVYGWRAAHRALHYSRVQRSGEHQRCHACAETESVPKSCCHVLEYHNLYLPITSVYQIFFLEFNSVLVQF